MIIFFLMIALPILALETTRFITYLPLLTFIFAIPFIQIKKNLFFQNNKKFLLFLGLFFIYLIAHSYFLSISTDDIDRLAKVIPLLISGILFLSVIEYFPTLDIEKLLRYNIILCSFAALFLTAEIILEGPIYKLIRGITDNNEMPLSVYNLGAVIITLYYLFCFFTYNSFRKWWLYLTILPFLILLFTTLSQSMQLGFFFFILFYLLFPVRLKSAWIFAFLLFAVHAILLPFIYPYIYQNIPALDAISFFQQSYSGNRLEIWDINSDAIRENPLIGYGLEYGQQVSTNWSKRLFYKENTFAHPHNVVLQTWLEFGVIGILFKIALIGFLMKKIYILDLPLQKAAISFLFTILLVNSFSYDTWQGTWIGFIFVVVGIISLVSKQSNTYKEQIKGL